MSIKKIKRLINIWSNIRKHSPKRTALTVLLPDFVFEDDRWWEGWRWNLIAFPIIESADWFNRNWPWCDHLITDDHCGKPECRYCLHCLRPFPNYPLSEGNYK